MNIFNIFFHISIFKILINLFGGYHYYCTFSFYLLVIYLLDQKYIYISLSSFYSCLSTNYIIFYGLWTKIWLNNDQSSLLLCYIFICFIFVTDNNKHWDRRLIGSNLKATRFRVSSCYREYIWSTSTQLSWLKLFMVLRLHMIDIDTVDINTNKIVHDIESTHDWNWHNQHN